MSDKISLVVVIFFFLCRRLYFLVGIEQSRHFDKGYRSVISKLVQLNIYEKPESEAKAIPTVKEMFIRIEELLDIRIDGTNLLKKENLYTLVQALEDRLGK